MEFEGRIRTVLPVRTGTSQKGEWKALPFVFEYYEHPTDHYPESVLLETMNHEMMRDIGRYVARGEDNKAIVKDGQCELTAEIRCLCGFSHHVNTFKRKDGTDGLMNNLRPYRLEIHDKPATADNTAAQQQTAPIPPQQPQEGGKDDLPF